MRSHRSSDDASAAVETERRLVPHLPGLDGIRGLSALAVLLFHTGVAWLPGGYLGVDIFFVVSGYLITALLLSERQRDGRISLSQFWQRRARRLFPVLALILLATTVYAAIQLSDDLLPHLRETAAALIYVTNWDLILRDVSYWDLFERPSQLRHLWSLAVEEQFYIIWPLMMFAVYRFAPARVQRLGLATLVVAGIVASVVWMWILHEPQQDASRVYFGSDTRAFTILIGVALAFVWRPWERRPDNEQVDNQHDPLLSQIATCVGLIGFGGLVWLTLSASSVDAWLYPWGLLLMSLAAAGLVGAVALRLGAMHHLLGSRPLRWLGERSYSIYLWHWPVVLALIWEFKLDPGSVELVVLCLAITVALAELSYRIVETPLRRPGFWRSLPRPSALMLRPLVGVALVAILTVGTLGATLLPSDRADGEFGSAVADDRGTEQADSSAERVRTPTISPDSGDAESQDESTPLVVTRPRPTVVHQAATQTEPVESQVQAMSVDASMPPTSYANEPPPQMLAKVAATRREPQVHTFQFEVQRGDSPLGIVERFGFRWNEYLEHNDPQAGVMLHPGDVLTLPCPGESACGIVEIRPHAETCIHANDDRFCQRTQPLISPPLRFRITPERFEQPPIWRWNGASVVAESFVLTSTHLAEVGADGVVPVLRGRRGLPPLAIGDAVMRDARFALREQGIEVDAVEGRTAQDSMAALSQHLELHGPDRVIIFQSLDFLESGDLAELMEIVSEVAHVIIVKQQTSNQLERDSDQTRFRYTDSNPNLTLLDWHGISDEQADDPITDDTDLTESGIALYVNLIADAVESAMRPDDSPALLPELSPALVALFDPTGGIGAQVRSFSGEPVLSPRITSPELGITAAAAMSAPAADESVQPQEWSFRYEVRAGDSASGVAKQFGTTLARLLQLNGDDHASWMHAGRRIQVPCPGDAPCGVVTVTPGIGVCVDWSTPTDQGNVCRRTNILVNHFPVQFSQVSTESVVTPRWQWAGHESRANHFTITLDMIEQLEPAERHLIAGSSLPPLAIGDSVMTGARDALRAVGIDVESEEGRLFDGALDILRQNLAIYGQREVIVFEAFGWDYVNAAAFARLLAAVGDAEHLIVLTRNMAFRSDILPVAREINEMLREQSSRYGWVTLLDWQQITSGREHELTYDGSHLNPAGLTLYAEVILEAILTGPAQARVSGSTSQDGADGG